MGRSKDQLIEHIERCNKCGEEASFAEQEQCFNDSMADQAEYAREIEQERRMGL